MLTSWTVEIAVAISPFVNAYASFWELGFNSNSTIAAPPSANEDAAVITADAPEDAPVNNVPTTSEAIALVPGDARKIVLFDQLPAEAFIIYWFG